MTITGFLLCAVVWLLSIAIVVRYVTYRQKKDMARPVDLRRDDERYPFWWE